MVYQIYYGNRKTVFDIEYYMSIDENKNDTEEKWYVELHSRPVLSESVQFVRDILKPELVEDFIKDCAELEDLRGWIWEKHRNRDRDIDTAEEDYNTWMVHIEERINSFCDKYGLKLNVDQYEDRETIEESCEESDFVKGRGNEVPEICRLYDI